MKTLLLVDLSLVASRVYYTTRDYSTVVSMIDKALNLSRANYIAICADPTSGRGENWRYQLYPQYKAHRDQGIDTINRHQFTDEMAIELIVNGYCVVMQGKAEADDIIATLAHRAPVDKIFVLSSDSDLCQLCSDKVTIISFETTTSSNGMRQSTQYLLHPEGVFNKYGVHPHQIPDFKALVGDKADNIVGCPGIGEKRAAQLIQQYGSVENLFLNMLPDQHWGDRLRDNEANIRLAKRLCQLTTDVELPFVMTLKDMKV